MTNHGPIILDPAFMTSTSWDRNSLIHLERTRFFSPKCQIVKTRLSRLLSQVLELIKRLFQSRIQL